MCDETSSRLLQWISEIEEKLANQDNVKEDVDQLRSQINAMKVSTISYPCNSGIPRGSSDDILDNCVASRFDNSSIPCFQEIKEDLEAHARPVSSCLDQIRQVDLTGGNVLSFEEVSTLERNGQSLKTRFQRATDRTERMVKRLIAARDELVKFK